LLKMDHLKEVVVVLTNHGPVKPSEEDVHFTTVYLNKTDLARFLPGSQVQTNLSKPIPVNIAILSRSPFLLFLEALPPKSVLRSLD